MNYAAGMSRETGKLLGFDEHLHQSIFDILMTPLGSRLIRRDYGSLLPYLLDTPITATTKIKMMAAIATALIKWEPRIKVRAVRLFLMDNGLTVTLELQKDNEPFATAINLTRGA